MANSEAYGDISSFSAWLRRLLSTSRYSAACTVKNAANVISPTDIATMSAVKIVSRQRSEGIRELRGRPGSDSPAIVSAFADFSCLPTVPCPGVASVAER